MRLTFRVLGPLEVARDGRAVPISAPKQRVILASLLLDAGRVVSVDRLVDHLWGDSPGRTARQTVQVYVTRLRDALGDDDAISTVHDGYRIDAGPGTLDLADFQVLTERAEHADAAGDRAGAAALLHQALGLWHGQVLSNVPSESLHRDAVPGLVERHLLATERRIELDLGLGHADDVVTELQQLTAEHWLRERLWALLMRALSYSGRQAEALETYRRVAALLADELGIDPGAELRDLHQTILAGELGAPRPDTAPVAPAAAMPPRQLPARPAGFVGRKPVLDGLLAAFTGQDAHPLVVLTGPPGVGKSAVAVCAGHLLKDEFPDGQLVVDLHGFSTSAAPRVTDVLARFLRALGMPPGQIPVDPEEQAAAYRSLLAGRSVLIVLDNAATADQVRPLLPGEPRCGVVITSRNQLRGLVALDGARLMPLDVLSADEALELLGAQVGADRLAAEPVAAAELARLCSYLPLALRITGANLAIRPYDKLADLAAELDMDDRLTSMWAPDDEQTRVTAAFGLSYAALDPDAQELFRLLGAIPGPDFTKGAVTALAGHQAAGTLDALVSASMVQPYAPGRYRMHDLTRSYAQRRSREAGDDDTALRRLFGWYLEMVDAAVVPRFPSRVRLRREPPSDEAVAKSSLVWVDDELPNLFAAVGHAAANGPPEIAWHLTDALRAYFQNATRYTEWDTMARYALRAAEREQATEAQAAMHLSLGVLAYLRQLDQEATDEMASAVELYEQVGDRIQQAGAWHNMAMAHHGAKRWTDALASLERALVIFRDEDHPHAAIASANLAMCKHDMGRVAEAVDDLVESLRLSRRFGDRESEGRTLTWLGDATRTLGELTASAGYLDEAATTLVELGESAMLLEAHTVLTRRHCDAGAYDRARQQGELAVALGRRLNDRRLALDAEVAAAEVDIRSGGADAWRDRLPDVLTELEQTHDEIRVSGCLVTLAWMYHALDDARRALDTSRRAVDHARQHVLQLDENAALTVLTAALVRSGHHDTAVEHGTDAVRRHRATGARLLEARALCHLGDAYLGRGDAGDARTCWQQARDGYAAIGVDEVAEATRRLSA